MQYIYCITTQFANIASQHNIVYTCNDDVMRDITMLNLFLYKEGLIIVFKQDAAHTTLLHQPSMWGAITKAVIILKLHAVHIRSFAQ